MSQNQFRSDIRIYRVINIKWVLLNITILFSIQSFSQPVDRVNDIEINSIGKPLRTVLGEISAQSGFNFIYRDDLIDDVQINCRIRSKSVDDALDKIFKQLYISYKVFNAKSIVLFREKKSKHEFYKAIVVENNEPNLDRLHVMVKPTMISNDKLDYPPEAVRNKIEGNVIVKFLINGAGEVSKALIKRSSGYGVLDSASINYARRLKFLPAEANGKTQNIWMTMKYKYYITNN